MHSSPYRHAFLARERSLVRASPMGNRDLAPLLIALWLASTIRVAIAFFYDETFGTELTIVFMTVVLVPVLLGSSWF
jgi:hypothetical protein